MNWLRRLLRAIGESARMAWRTFTWELRYADQLVPPPDTVRYRIETSQAFANPKEYRRMLEAAMRSGASGIAYRVYPHMTDFVRDREW